MLGGSETDLSKQKNLMYKCMYALNNLVIKLERLENGNIKHASFERVKVISTLNFWCYLPVQISFGTKQILLYNSIKLLRNLNDFPSHFIDLWLIMCPRSLCHC